MLRSCCPLSRPWSSCWLRRSARQPAFCRYRQERASGKQSSRLCRAATTCCASPTTGFRAACTRPSILQHFLDSGARMTRGAHHAWAQIVAPGDTVVDATCGNGNDTLYLSQLVGPSGRVYAFDIQEAAIRSASYIVHKGLLPEDTPELTFLQHCHSRMQEHVQPPTNSVKLVCFNLGYFPGSNKDEQESGTRIVTQPNTTIAAITAALDLLQEGGAVSVLAYSAHAGGMEEFLAVQALAGSLPSKQWVVSCTNIVNRTQAPVLFLFYKLQGRNAAKGSLQSA
ncbi:hypothetical protein WJX73_009643 [Symbiochloris irregularis]|uniref:rRNA methylase n=1 Tax=Symbiochloris irregularis TaxID=706552 RepID=A0AAW1PR06_9CHLO